MLARLLTCVVLAACLAGPVRADDAARSLPVERVRAALTALFETFTGRALTPDEAERVTREYIAMFDEDGCGPSCARMLEENNRLRAIVEAEDGRPLGLLTRHYAIAQTYFNDQRGSLIQRLFAEADPICVVDPKSKRLMTERDAWALANLQRLAETGRLEEGPLDRSRVLEACARLDRLVGSAPDVMTLHMPPLWAMAAAFWEGVKDAWPALDEAWRADVRDLIRAPLDTRPSAELFARLLGLAPADAETLAGRYATAAQVARINAAINANMQVTLMSIRHAAVLDALSIFD